MVRGTRAAIFIEVIGQDDSFRRQLKARESHIEDIVYSVQGVRYSLLGDGDSIKEQFDPTVSRPD